MSSTSVFLIQCCKNDSMFSLFPTLHPMFNVEIFVGVTVIVMNFPIMTLAACVLWPTLMNFGFFTHLHPASLTLTFQWMRKTTTVQLRRMKWEKFTNSKKKFFYGRIQLVFQVGLIYSLFNQNFMFNKKTHTVLYPGVCSKPNSKMNKDLKKVEPTYLISSVFTLHFIIQGITALKADVAGQILTMTLNIKLFIKNCVIGIFSKMETRNGHRKESRRCALY